MDYGARTPAETVIKGLNTLEAIEANSPDLTEASKAIKVQLDAKFSGHHERAMAYVVHLVFQHSFTYLEAADLVDITEPGAYWTTIRFIREHKNIKPGILPNPLTD